MASFSLDWTIVFWIGYPTCRILDAQQSVSADNRSESKYAAWWTDSYLRTHFWKRRNRPTSSIIHGLAITHSRRTAVSS
jgi:hypothetical protein